jgi:tetratricopeptide (TPR) repeat protein
LGDADGLDDLRRALALGLERGAGRDTALVYANLAGVSWLIEGPAASLAVYEEGIEFARRRGIAEFALITEAASLEALFDLGRWDDVLELADRLDEPLAASQAALDLLWMRTVRAHVLAERGRFDDVARIVEQIGAEVRAEGEAQLMVPTFTVHAMCLAASGRLEEAGEVIAELVELQGISSDPNCLPYLRTISELAVSCGHAAFVPRLLEGIGETTARHRAVAASVAGVAAEETGDLEEAARAFADAVDRWHRLGVVPEEAAARAGAARVLAPIGRQDEAQAEAERAKELRAELRTESSAKGLE